MTFKIFIFHMVYGKAPIRDGTFLNWNFLYLADMIIKSFIEADWIERRYDVVTYTLHWPAFKFPYVPLLSTPVKAQPRRNETHSAVSRPTTISTRMDDTSNRKHKTIRCILIGHRSSAFWRQSAFAYIQIWPFYIQFHSICRFRSLTSWIAIQWHILTLDHTLFSERN